MNNLSLTPANKSPAASPNGMKSKSGSKAKSWLRKVTVTPLTGKVAAIYLIFMYVIVFASPLFYHQSPDAANPLAMTQGPSAHHLLGTDDLGRDELARVLAGGKITLLVGLAAMAIAITVGGFLGSVAAFFKGWVSTVIMRVVDVMLSIPSFFLVLIEITSFGHSPTIVILVVGLTFWPQIARVVYAEVLKWRDSPLVEAAVVIGSTKWRVLFRHVIPQVFSSLVVLSTLGVGWAILAESGLSYLGLGIQPPQASWGNMLQNSQTYIWTDPMLGIYPGILIFVTVLAFSILGEALRDAFDPRLRERR
jgi:peptide/nickel transport system permease protein